jgi:hypothetical protein
MKIIKLFLGIVVFLVAILVILLLGRNFLIKHIVQLGAKNSLGMEIKIDKLNVGLFRSFIRIDGLKVYNPKGFEGEVLATVPLIYVDYEPVSILKRKLHCNQIEININEIAIIKNQKGELNLNKLRAIGKSSKGTSENNDKEKKGEKEVKIDQLILTFDHIKFINYSGRKRPREIKIAIGLDHQKFENFSSVKEVIQLIILKALMYAGLQNIEVIKKGIGEMESGREFDEKLKSQAKKLREKTREFLKTLKPFKEE